MTYEEAVAAVPAGLYRHFKGNCYKVLCISRHSETTEPMVVYKALYGDGGVWVRPAEMWNEVVEREGISYRRFRPLSAEERVVFYEELFDEVNPAVEEENALSDELRFKVSLLEDYYTSGEWLRDYEADEAGFFPEDMKRGVLSQDGLFDLLAKIADRE